MIGTWFITAQIDVKRLLWRGALTLVLPMSLRTFQFFPGMLYAQEAWFVLCMLAVVFAYPYWKVRTGLRFSRFEVYLLVLMIFSIIVAAWQAQLVFGQPYMYGVLSQRSLVLIAVWLVLANLLEAGLIRVDDLGAVLLFLAWGTFALFAAMRLFLNPAHFVEYGEGLVTRAMVGTEPNFKLPEFFVLFGVFYYAMLGFRTGRIRYYLAAAALFPVTLSGSGRGLMLCVAATLLFFLYRIRGFRRATFATAIFAGLGAIPLIGLYILFPTSASARVNSFADAFKAVLTGSPTQDPSANARIIETVASLPYIEAHPLLGNGIVSHQWQGGSHSALGVYFFAADIGILGIVFSYGIVGVLLYFWQYRFAWRASKEIGGSLYDPLLDATKAFLFYSAIYSLESGLCVWNADATLFFVTFLNGLALRAQATTSSESWTGSSCRRQRLALSA